MSNASSATSSPSASDPTNGVWSGLARLNGVAAVPAVVPATGGTSWTGYSFVNDSSVNGVVVTLALAGAAVNDTQVYVPPKQTRSGSFDSDTITGISFLAVQTPAAGSITNASAMVALAAAPAQAVDVSWQLVNQ